MLKIFFVFIFAHSLSFAQGVVENCARENLTSKFSDVRGHGGADWCWANAVADLVGYAQGVEPPDRISSVDVGASYFSINPESMVKSMETVYSFPFVPDPYLNEIKRIQEKMKNDPIGQIWGSEVFATLTYQSRPGYCLEKNVKLEYVSQNSYIVDYLKTLHGSIDDRVIWNCLTENDQMKKLQDFRLELNKKIVSQIEEQLDSECKPRNPMQPMYPSTLVLKNDALKRPATEIIKSRLNSKAPVAIAFDSDVLFKDNYGSKANHIGIITESRLIGGRCQYRLRDAQGADCKIYSKRIQKRCSAGYIWLTSDEINRSTERLFAIDKNKDLRL